MRRLTGGSACTGLLIADIKQALGGTKGGSHHEHLPMLFRTFAGHITLNGMKVTIQNGAEHGLTRLDVESIIPLFPSAWAKHVDQIVLYQSLTGSLVASFYPGQRVLGLHWPRPKELASKEDGIRELLLALSVAAELGELPSKLAKSLRQRHLVALEKLHRRCTIVVAEHAA